MQKGESQSESPIEINVQESKHFEIVRPAVVGSQPYLIQFQPIRPESNCSSTAQRHPLDYEIKMDDGRNENGIFNELLPWQRPNELVATEQWSGDKTMENWGQVGGLRWDAMGCDGMDGNGAHQGRCSQVGGSTFGCPAL